MTDGVVFISFRDREGAQSHIQLPWVKNKDLRDYLRDPALRKYHLLSMALRCRLIGNRYRKMRLTYPLEAGETVHLIQARHI